MTTERRDTFVALRGLTGRHHALSTTHTWQTRRAALMLHVTNASPLIVLHPEHVQAEDLKVIVNVRPCWIIDHRGDSRPDKIITTERLAAQPLPVTAEVMTLIAPHVDQFRPADVVYWLTGTLDVINRCFKFQQRQRSGWDLWLDYHHDQQHRITDLEMCFIND